MEYILPGSRQKIKRRLWLPKNNIEYKECKGCRWRSRCSIRYNFSKLINKCPCSICLIKGICHTGWGCTQWTEFSYEVYNKV